MKSLTLVLINNLPEVELTAFTESTQIGYNPGVLENEYFFNMLIKDIKDSGFLHLVLDPESSDSIVLGGRVICEVIEAGIPFIVHVCRRFNSHSQDQEVNLTALQDRINKRATVIFNFTGTGVANCRNKVKAIDSYIQTIADSDTFDATFISKVGQKSVTGIRHQKNRLGETLSLVTAYDDLIELSKVMTE